MGVFKMRALTEFTVTVIGLMFANACSQSGIVSMGTKMELANMMGKTQTNPATWAVSAFLTNMPLAAETQEKANPRHADSKSAKAICLKPASGVNPIMAATQIMSSMTKILRIKSANVLPAKTAD